MSRYDCDLFIIGAGPAGTAAAVYASQAGLETVINEKDLVGGQAAQSFEIQNYPGFDLISGSQLAEKFTSQIKKSGVKLEEFDEIESVFFTDTTKKIVTDNNIYYTDAVIIATGAKPRRLPIAQESMYSGKGIHYCALCDGSAYKNKIAAVTGSGNAALEEALYLAGIAEKVHIFCRSASFHGESSLIDRVDNESKIEIHYNTNIVLAGGEKLLEYVETENTQTGKTEKVNIDGLFVCIGRVPQTELFGNRIELDEKGYIKTDENFMTNVKGVYAAGDVRQKKWRQIVTAVSDGASAALEAEKFIRSKSKDA